VSGGRFVLLAGAAAFFVAALLFVGGGTPRDASGFPAGSIFNETPRGLSLAYRYLGPRARLLSRRLEPGAADAGAVVFRVRPRGGPERRKDTKEAEESILTAGERAWVASGGRLVLAVDERLGPLRLSTGDGGAVAKVLPLWPGVRRVEPPGPARALGTGLPPGTRTVVARGREPLIARWRHARGEVVFLAGPEALENAGLHHGDHLALLEALTAGRSAAWFDEHAHGLREDKDALDLLVDWGFGPALLTGALLGVLAFWRARARVGPPDADRRGAPADAVELLDSLARLYDRALGGGEALSLYRQHLSRAVAHETGLRGDALEARVTEMTGGRAAQSPVFPRVLQALNQGYRRLKHAQAR
jgi:hypothetical protein